METKEISAPCVLAVIDSSPFSEAVVDYSNWIAKTIDAPLKFINTIEHKNILPVADLSGAIGLGASEGLLNELTEVEQNRSRLLLKKGSIMLKAAKQKALDAGLVDVEKIQQHGSRTETLIEMEDQTRVLVVGVCDKDSDDSQDGLGDKLETVIRSLHKPILVVNKEFEMPESIMLAYDGSRSAKKALDMVSTSPLFKDITCHLVHVVSNIQAEDEILDQAKVKLESTGLNVISAKLSGNVGDELIKYRTENNIDLTVMGAFSHNRLRNFLLGSFTAKMMENTKKPLLLLR